MPDLSAYASTHLTTFIGVLRIIFAQLKQGVQETYMIVARLRSAHWTMLLTSA